MSAASAIFWKTYRDLTINRLFKRTTKLARRTFNGAPNNQWPWGSIALPASGRACARSRRGRAGLGRGCCRTHRRMRPQPMGEGGCPGLGPSSWQNRSISALALRRLGKCAWSLLRSHHRLDRCRLVALTRPWVCWFTPEICSFTPSTHSRELYQQFSNFGLRDLLLNINSAATTQ